MSAKPWLLTVALAGALALVARSMTWHRDGQTGFTLLPSALDVVIVAASAALVCGAVAVAIRPAPQRNALLGALAVALASLLAAALLALGDDADAPTAGAWWAGAAFAVVMTGATGLLAPSLRGRTGRAVAVLATFVVVAGAIVVGPTDRPFHDVEVAR